ncbi:MAG: protein translocase subunit SecD [Gammaproteobacteria bacterium]
MTHFTPPWKTLLVIALVLLGMIYALPNLYGDDPSIQISGKNNFKVSNITEETVKKVIATAQLSAKQFELDKNANQLLVRFNDVEDQLKAQDIVKKQLGDGYAVALNLAAKTPGWLARLGAQPMKLGLDLRGGVHFLMTIDVDSLIERRLTGDVRTLTEALRNSHIRYTSVRRSGDAIVMSFRDAEERERGLNLIKRSFPELVARKTGVAEHWQLSATMTPSARLQAQNYAVDQTMTILRNRINELGVAEPIVQRQGADRVVVDLPGIQDTARAKQILGGTATLEFHMVDVTHDIREALQGNMPIGSRLYHYNDRPYLLKNQVILSGASIAGALSSFDEQGQPAVNVRLGGGGESLFHRVTRNNIGKPMSIVYVETVMKPYQVNGSVQYRPKKQERIISVATIRDALGNNFVISGLTDAQEARDLALLLRAGALPAPINIIEESTVGPSLGKMNIRKGIISIEVGFAFIVLFMIAYYRFFGFVADIALAINLVLMVAILSIIGATLTLPGIAGIVLTVGMAVDANVLIFERIREELRNGTTPIAAIHAGYDRALATIIDSNVTTLIAAVALFALGTGAIKGFAVTLSIGLLVSMLTAITVTRIIVNSYYSKRRGGRLKLSIGINHE